MRKKLETLVKAELRTLALQTRAQKGLTQREMSELLSMSESSYSDIETGLHKCGTLTTILLLVENEAPQDILNAIRRKIIQLYKEG